MKFFPFEFFRSRFRRKSLKKFGGVNEEPLHLVAISLFPNSFSLVNLTFKILYTRYLFIILEVPGVQDFKTSSMNIWG
jgi:hypothetical protein